MKKNHLASADLHLTALGLGCAGLGNLYEAISEDVATEIVLAAWHEGVRYFDTAPLYGYGLSEYRLGNILKQYPRNEYLLSTKVGRVLKPGGVSQSIFVDALPFHDSFDYSYDGVMRSFEESLERLATDYIDILYVHDLGRVTHGEKHEHHLKIFLESGCRALAELREQKCIHAMGLGVNEWEVCLELFPHVEVNCIMLAGRYTLLDHSIPDDFFEQCALKNVSLIIAGVYNSGILAGGEHFNYEIADDAIKKRVQALKEMCVKNKIELPHAAVQFPLQHPSVVAIVSGAKSAAEIQQTAGYVKRPIT